MSIRTSSLVLGLQRISILTRVGGADGGTADSGP